MQDIRFNSRLFTCSHTPLADYAIAVIATSPSEKDHAHSVVRTRILLCYSVILALHLFSYPVIYLCNDPYFQGMGNSLKKKMMSALISGLGDILFHLGINRHV